MVVSGGRGVSMVVHGVARRRASGLPLRQHRFPSSSSSSSASTARRKRTMMVPMEPSHAERHCCGSTTTRRIGSAAAVSAGRPVVVVGPSHRRRGLAGSSETAGTNHSHETTPVPPVPRTKATTGHGRTALASSSTHTTQEQQQQQHHGRGTGKKQCVSHSNDENDATTDIPRHHSHNRHASATTTTTSSSRSSDGTGTTATTTRTTTSTTSFDIVWDQLQSWPNRITVARMLSTPWLGYWIVTHQTGPAVVGCCLAAASDVADGYLARQCGMTTALGTYLDPMADKLFIGVVAVSLAANGTLPVPVVALWLTKDVGLMVATYCYVRRTMTDKPIATTSLQVHPTVVSKVNTALQFGTLALGIAHPWVMDAAAADHGSGTVLALLAGPVLPTLCWITCVTTVASLGSYWQHAAVNDDDSSSVTKHP